MKQHERERRRVELVARLAHEREEITQLLARIQAPVRRAEHVKDKTEEVVKRYAALWIPVALLALVRSRHLLGWVAKAVPVYHVFRAFRRMTGDAPPQNKSRSRAIWERLSRTRTAAKIEERLNGRNGRSA